MSDSDAGSSKMVKRLELPVEDLRRSIATALEEAASDFRRRSPERLGEAMSYALLAPGKRLRPLLVLMAAEAVGGGEAIEAAIPAAVAVEMVHAYSLVHDDLPAMDDDDLRRGRPTTHIKFDQATAILAGDALLTEAFIHLSDHVVQSPQRGEVIRILAHASGSAALVGGQADDLAAERDPDAMVTWDVAQRLKFLESVHRRKTGALFTASLEMGAILGGGGAEALAALQQYSRDVGLAFQVVDDLLDWTSTAEMMGKQTGKDHARGKLTYPGLLGIEAAKERASELIASAIESLDRWESVGKPVQTHGTGDGTLSASPQTDRLRTLAKYVLERSH